MSSVCTEAAEKSQANNLAEKKQCVPLHNMDDIFLYKTPQVDGRVSAQRSYLYLVTNSPLEDIAPTADNRLRQESCP